VFTWESAGGDTSSAYMKDISFEARPGTLTMVVGSVASGKTSLLSALIGQMERLQGTVAVGGRVAYVAQTAWIINDSVQVGVGLGPDRGHGVWQQAAVFAWLAHEHYGGREVTSDYGRSLHAVPSCGFPAVCCWFRVDVPSRCGHCLPVRC
jgi:ATPase subunit of ABC transporter with duplicated ATPase domains